MTTPQSPRLPRHPGPPEPFLALTLLVILLTADVNLMTSLGLTGLFLLIVSHP